MNIRGGIMEFCRYPKTVKQIIEHFSNTSRGTISYHLKNLTKECIFQRDKKPGKQPTYFCKFIMDRENFCYFCDYEKEIHKHHIVHRKDGGLDEDSNILKLCKPCHIRIHSGKGFLDLSGGYWYMRDTKTLEIIKYPSMKHLHDLRDPPIKSIIKSKSTLTEIKVDKYG